MPEPLAVPRTHLRLVGARLQPLPTDAPAEVRALHHVMPARLVAAIAVVVGREKVAVVVEGEFLRVAQTPRNHLELAAIRVRAKDAAGISEQLGRKPRDGILDL